MPGQSKVQARAEGATPYAGKVARAIEERADGPTFYKPNPVFTYIPRDHFVYIFSLWPAEIEVERAGKIKIPACKEGDRVSEPVRYGAVVSSTFFDAQTQSMKTDDILSEYVAQDIIHPYLGGDWSIGQNLDERGVFWTRNEVPTDEEIAVARAKLEVFFRRQLAYATELETTNRLFAITPVMRLAAVYFKQDRAWNRIYQKHEDCPGCGETIKPGIIKHSCGMVFDWPRALAFGLVSPEQAQNAGIDPETGKPAAKGKQAKKDAKDGQ